MLTAVVAGDIFSVEDRFGTWKTILTRSRSRGQLFAGKFLAALTFAVALLRPADRSPISWPAWWPGRSRWSGSAASSCRPGTRPSWSCSATLSDLPPLLGFTALALMLSVVSRNSVVGIGGPIVITLVLQVVTLISLPALGTAGAASARPSRPGTGSGSSPRSTGEFRWGLVTSAAWFVVCAAVSWLVFRRRAIGVAS